ncbi:HalOD1 output domain-containing protein [Natronorubrum sp. DTA7]|uniref:HalOD1 output domain-containing protein n=1 Tax=Natronorubrum sp. DTA7 TaxID=3447016 RepID=UPI003F868B99
MSGTTRDRLTPVSKTVDRQLYYDEGRGTYHAWCADADYEPVSTGLVMAVSSILEADPADLDSLSASIDPDALNALVGHWGERESQGGRNSIAFSFADCLITVYSDGEIVIDPDHPVDGPIGA